MSYEDDLQMHFVDIGVKEGEQRGRLQAYTDIAKRMRSLGLSEPKIAQLMGLTEEQVKGFLSC